MALPGNKNFSDYDNYITDQNPTTAAQAQDYFRNQAELLKAVIDCDFWQPETVYQPGDVVKSDSMPNGTEAVMVATKASVTSNVEPSWGEVGGANVSDGACFWKLRWQHWSKSVEEITNLTTGATNRLPNTNYAVGSIVYSRSNLSVALKCTTAGTTSNTELDVSGKNIGDTVTDGSVVWKVCNRTSDVTSVNGKIGDVVVGEIVDASISGKTITLTFADGSTKTLTTQDTNTIPATFPNWAAGINVAFPTSSAKYTAPTDGLYVCNFIPSSSGTNVQLVVNNVATAVTQRASNNYGQNRSSVSALLKKGDVIYWNGNGTQYTGAFYPLKT